MDPPLPSVVRIQDWTSPWTRDRRAVPLVLVGLALLASGCAHLAVWAATGGPWEGPVTWRKPILFGISGGLTSLSLGWAWSRLPWRRGDAWLAASVACALFVEVGLIDMQAWRGVASHFNRATPLDSVLYDAMGVLILWVTLACFDLAIRFFRQPTPLAPDMLLAGRAGLVFLVISCLLGIWVSVHGDLRQAAGLEPERYGAAGVPKFPHGAVIHAVQWLPLLAWAARRSGIGERRRTALVRLATAGTALVLAYAVAQTLAGRARSDATPATLALLAVGGCCLVAPAVAVAAALCRRIVAAAVACACLVACAAGGAHGREAGGVLSLPPMQADAAPAAGRRVAVTPPEYAGTQVHHSLWLPADWNPAWRGGKTRWPVIVEYTGNSSPAHGSTGRVQDAGLGYGLSAARFIWVVLPYVADDGRHNEVTWWGDVEATVAYAKKNVPRICAEFGGDPGKVLVCGFSRGAIGVNFIGLHDDEIAGLWCGFVSHDHYDGVREWRGTSWGAPLAAYRRGAAARLARLRGRPALICEGGGTGRTKAWLDASGAAPADVTYLDVRIGEIFPRLPCEPAPGMTVVSGHTDRWPLVESADTAAARAWVERVVAGRGSPVVTVSGEIEPSRPRR